MENKKEETKNHEEHIIITPHDVSMPHHVAENYEHMYFYCPKCNSSLIYMPEEYTKNNLINSMKPQSDPSVMPDHQVNEGWMKVVLKCDNCKWADIIMKFMKEIERPDYSSLLDTYQPIRRRYTTSSNKPSWFKKYSTAQSKRLKNLMKQRTI